MENKKKIATLGVSSLLLVAMVVALTVSLGEDEKNEGDSRDISSSTKAIQTICDPTDYKETCVDTLKSSNTENTSDPKELIEVAFEVTIKYMEQASKNSTVLQELQKDPRAKEALENCNELANRAANDLRRSLDKFKEFDVSSFDGILSDLKIWLSGSVTYQETCLDGFEDVPGDAEEKMRKALKKSMELTSNGLAMVTEIGTVLESFGIQGNNNRRLLADDLPIMGHRSEIPTWIDFERRGLLQTDSKKIKADLVVAKDGSGKYKTINEALKDIPKNGNKTFVLYVHTYRQFYRECVISGTIDFIFGDAAALFQGCTMVVRKPMDNQQNIVTAQGRKDIRQPTGIVLQNCTITADPKLYPVRQTLKSYLGRPWKEFSRTIIMESYLEDLIQPQGWLPWNETFALETLFYAEFNNRGPGAPKAERIKWPGVKELSPTRVERFTAARFIVGDVWVKPTGVPYSPGFIFSVPKQDPNGNYTSETPEEEQGWGTDSHVKTTSLSNSSSSSGEKKDNSESSSGSEYGQSPATAPAPGPIISTAASPAPDPAPSSSDETISIAASPDAGAPAPGTALLEKVVEKSTLSFSWMKLN